MTLKTKQSSLKQTNGAQMERVFAVPVLWVPRLIQHNW
jgi:hypothetical protein